MIEKLPFSQAWQKRPMGYPRLAERIALKPETGIYRRFDALNARNLLYMQAELCALERILRIQEDDDNRSSESQRSHYATDLEYMLRDADNVEKEQLCTILQIRQKLKEYNKALIQQEVLHRLRSPDHFDLKDINCFLYSEQMGGGRMKGEDHGTWGAKDDIYDHPPDIVAVKPRLHVDKFSRYIAENTVHLFKCGLGRFTKRDRHLGTRVYYDDTVLKITLWMTSLVASLIPVASILVLREFHTDQQKLGVIAGFNVLITLCLLLFTEARRTDIFAVTAA
ncbi:hypothetical protein CC80DRAFT_577070 [Byssothecium circinans]|uniref:DUF6594 domain-containing protein n=1 Tax=Byssothecium circinans TaxID=147558 RepID=A0A6A5TFD1_9PLEO|nr:hypothetical protein CC80DRAFT_577070 [Byssothecium circinans]